MHIIYDTFSHCFINDKIKAKAVSLQSMQDRVNTHDTKPKLGYQISQDIINFLIISDHLIITIFYERKYIIF